MSASRSLSFQSGGIPRSRSEGTLIDFDDRRTTEINKSIDIRGNEFDLLIDWPKVHNQHPQNNLKSSNPFWKELSESNPFLDEIAKTATAPNGNKTMSILKEDPYLLFRDTDARDSVASSGDELDINFLLKNTSSKKTARSKSVSDVLDILDGKDADPHCISDSGQFLAPDLEWLQNDREAYKMAWLSHRQLTRSCLDLDVMSQSPGWAQTQAMDTHIICRIDHQGGSLQLPNSDITVHVPEGHVTPGTFQEVGLKALLYPPSSLNNDFQSTASPLLEITLTNLKNEEAILLEMKIAAQVKKDPLSQVMTEIVCLYSYKKDGPFEQIDNSYIYNDTIQVKLTNLGRVTYIVVVAKAKAIQPPATSVWDYIDKTLTVGIYGPKHIHPAFTVVCSIFGHNYTPEKLTISDIKKGGKNLPPVVFNLWGTHQFTMNELKDLSISLTSVDSDFLVKSSEQTKEIQESQLKAGTVIRQQFPFSSHPSGEIHSFNFIVHITDSRMARVTEFSITTPDPAPKLLDTPTKPTRLQKRKEIKSAPLPLLVTIKYPTFQDKPLNINKCAVTLKTVLRQSKIDYLLEYFKGDTIALLGEDKIKAIGQTKVKEWYVGVLRGKVGLVHCRNVKVISKEQVIDFSDIHLTTTMLLNQMTLPFKKLTYIYSSVLSTVSDKVYDWRPLANVLGYKRLTLDDVTDSDTGKESDQVAFVIKKLKEDCHSDAKKRKFHYELIVMMWKPAFDFLFNWGAHYGESYRDVLQDLQSAMDKMKNPVTRQWRELTGALILVNCMDIFRGSAFSKAQD
ncbi:metastasis-associated in colon cancer protein 1 isoform X2 [Ambystoma mexicanum]|uniref:metastasis-associated in colon cancer protein 1 isoform X2 n=1 Tax=Ambystoma mexicanum TaxID=8296 RepID=UPI0037E70DFB